MANIQREVTVAVVCSVTSCAVIARDGELVSLKQPEKEEEEEENDRSRMVPL